MSDARLSFLDWNSDLSVSQGDLAVDDGLESAVGVSLFSDSGPLTRPDAFQPKEGRDRLEKSNDLLGEVTALAMTTADQKPGEPVRWATWR